MKTTIIVIACLTGAFLINPTVALYTIAVLLGGFAIVLVGAAIIGGFQGFFGLGKWRKPTK